VQQGGVWKLTEGARAARRRVEAYRRSPCSKAACGRVRSERVARSRRAGCWLRRGADRRRRGKSERIRNPNRKRERESKRQRDASRVRPAGSADGAE